MPLYILLDYESYADLKKLIFHKNSIKSLSPTSNAVTATAKLARKLATLHQTGAILVY